MSRLAHQAGDIAKVQLEMAIDAIGIPAAKRHQLHAAITALLELRIMEAERRMREERQLEMKALRAELIQEREQVRRSFFAMNPNLASVQAPPVHPNAFFQAR